MPAASAADPTPRNPRRENISFLESLFASSLFVSSLFRSWRSLFGSKLVASKLIKSSLALFFGIKFGISSTGIRLRLPSTAKRYERHTVVSILGGARKSTLATEKIKFLAKPFKRRVYNLKVLLRASVSPW